MWLAQYSVADMLQWVARIDQHPPLYYLLLHYWVALNGDTPYSLRLLSATFGAGTIPIIYLIGKRMSGEVVGLAAAVLLAFSPFNIRFAQDARMYTLLAFNAAAAKYALVRLLTDPRSARPIGSQFQEYLHAWRTAGPVEPENTGDYSYKDLTRSQTGWRAWISRHRWSSIRTVETNLAWIVLIVFSAATLLTHNAGVLFLFAANLFVLGLMVYQRSVKPAPPAFLAPSFRNWVVAQVAVFLLWSPWIVAFIRQAGGIFQESGIPEPGWEAVLQALKSFLNDFTSGQSGLVTMVWIVYAAVLCLGLAHYRKKISQFLFLASLFAVPILGELVARASANRFFPIER